MDTLSKQIRTFLLDSLQVKSEDRILVACSGGKDSVVLCHLLKSIDQPFGIAHCNFQLRGLDSDVDEAFVYQLAQELEVPIYSKRFETKQEAEKQKKSIQETARTLRYDWFESIRQEHHFDYIATAHHLSDNIETLVLNLSQGTGIKGLTGIPNKRESIIRPINWAKRSQIDGFAYNHNIQWREDSTNQSSDYSRNKIRHEVLPVLSSINPGLESNFESNLQNFRESAWLQDYALNHLTQNLVVKKRDHTTIEWKPIMDLPVRKTVFFHLLKPFGFKPKQVNQLIQFLEKENSLSGKFFESSDFTVWKDRVVLILKPKTQVEVKPLHFTLETNTFHLPEGILHLEIKKGPVSIDTRPNMAFLDADKLDESLCWRMWEAGDRFQPLGLSAGRQKVKDFLINRKVPVAEKSQAFVLLSSEQIVWLAPFRIADPFKVQDSSKRIAVFTWEPRLIPKD